MNDIAAQTGTVEEVKDLGTGPDAVVKRWVMELDLADKQEKDWRHDAGDVYQRYRDEKDSGRSTSGSHTIPGSSSRHSASNRYNILYSNVQTITPALFGASPSPDVRRRNREKDKTGGVIAQVLERALSYTMDEGEYDRFLKLGIKDQQLGGRGLCKIVYKPYFQSTQDEGGEAYDDLAYEEVVWEHVNWQDFRRGPGRTWEEVTWIAFRTTMTRTQLIKAFGEKIGNAVELDYTPIESQGNDDDELDPSLADSFKRARVWAVWDKDERQVVFISKTYDKSPLKTEDDPMGLKGFFPIPRPLYATDNTDSLTPVEPYRYYREQAEELDVVTKRIAMIVEACKVAGIYDSRLSSAMRGLLESGEARLEPAEDILTLSQVGSGLENAIWLWPVDRIAEALVHLYTQREAIKQTIYEITGIADIMRGSTAASETLGAQQLKAQFGTMRLDDSRDEVKRYGRDMVRLAAEVISERFRPETLELMTQVELPTAEEKAVAQQQAQQLRAQQQPIPEKLKKTLTDPTWDECMEVLRSDKQRTYRVDIETDATVAGDEAADKKAVTELLSGIATFIQQAGPAVKEGYIPLEAAKAILMTAVRKFKMGREVEFALDMIGEEDDGEEQTIDPAFAQAQEQMQVLMEQNQELQAAAQQADAQAAQAQDQAAQANDAVTRAGADIARERKIIEREFQVKVDELAVKDRAMAVREKELAAMEATDPALKAEIERQIEQDKLAHQAEEKMRDRQVDLVKAIISKSGGEGDIEALADDAFREATEILADE